MVNFTQWRSLVDGSEVNAIPDNLVDNFELQSANPSGVYASGETIGDYYSGDTGSATLTTSNVPEGNRALSVSGATIASFPGDGLNQYPDPGDTIRSLYRYVDANLPFDGLFVNVSGSPGNFSGYSCITRLNGVGGHRIYKHTDGSVTEIAATSGISESGWVWHEIKTPSSSDNELVWDIYEYNGSRGSLLKTLSVNYNDHLGNGIGLASLSGSDPHTVLDGVEVLSN